MLGKRKGPQAFLQAFAILIVAFGLLHMVMVAGGHNVGEFIPLSIAIVTFSAGVVERLAPEHRRDDSEGKQ